MSSRRNSTEKRTATKNGELTTLRELASLRITDNGRGFGKERKQRGKHWGLINMRERASYVNGAFSVESQRGKGATLELKIPL